MLLKIKHCKFYHFKEMGEHRNEQRIVIKHWFEIFSCWLLMLRYGLAMISYLWDDALFPYWRYDPFTYYLHECFGEAFIIYLVIITMPLVLAFGLIFIFHICTAFNACIFNYMYELIVVNTEQIDQCLIDKQKQNRLLEKEFHFNLNRLKSNAGIFWKILPIQFVLKRICFYQTKNSFQFNRKIVEWRKLSKLKLTLIPFITVEFRLKLAQLVAFNDWLNYILIVFSGN